MYICVFIMQIWFQIKMFFITSSIYISLVSLEVVLLLLLLLIIWFDEVTTILWDKRVAATAVIAPDVGEDDDVEVGAVEEQDVFADELFCRKSINIWSCIKSVVNAPSSIIESLFLYKSNIF